ncbi:N-acetyltransferase 9 [Actinomortierella ambigua]|uniref:N-acetyltransferase 9 n=1 Tax=Actinomortierella ambigua TaxID=1343610 RepID=A0A9P6Q1S6_9FUNG|nr:N-acetyltransferase 9 [Actinomortierella ambigua]
MQSPELLELTASEPLTLEEEYEMQRSWHVDENTMVGDVNLFYNDHDDPQSAEIEIMIAEPSYRRKGVGLEALKMMMTYAFESLKTKRITSKISTENASSIALFTNKLGFVQISFSEIFGEVTLESLLDPSHAQDAVQDGMSTVSAPKQAEEILVSSQEGQKDWRTNFLRIQLPSSLLDHDD